MSHIEGEYKKNKEIYFLVSIFILWTFENGYPLFSDTSQILMKYKDKQIVFLKTNNKI